MQTIISVVQFLINQYYDGKLFGLCSGEHSYITEANFGAGTDFIRFEENTVKTFHGGFTDLIIRKNIQ